MTSFPLLQARSNFYYSKHDLISTNPSIMPHLRNKSRKLSLAPGPIENDAVFVLHGWSHLCSLVQKLFINCVNKTLSKTQMLRRPTVCVSFSFLSGRLHAFVYRMCLYMYTDMKTWTTVTSGSKVDDRQSRKDSDLLTRTGDCDLTVPSSSPAVNTTGAPLTFCECLTKSQHGGRLAARATSQAHSVHCPSQLVCPRHLPPMYPHTTLLLLRMVGQRRVGGRVGRGGAG